VFSYKQNVKYNGKVILEFKRLSNTPWRRIGLWRLDPPFMASVLDEVGWLASRSGRLTPMCTFDKRFGGPHSRAGRCGKKSFYPPRIEARFRVTLYPVAMLVENVLSSDFCGSYCSILNIMSPYFKVRLKKKDISNFLRFPPQNT
jgi:hypothetical protein